METAKEKIERWKQLAELFLNKNIQAYIRELNGDLHFCNIILVGEDSVYVENFGPPQRAGKKEPIYWMLVSDFDEYKDKEEKI